jgi:DNA modification methylase
MPDESVQCCVTSPPYWGLRDYGIPPTSWPALSYKLPGGVVEVPELSCALGLEPTPEQFVGHLVLVLREVGRVLRSDGTLWLNLGDSYAGGGCGARDPERWPKQSRNDHMPTHAKRSHDRKKKDLIGVPWLVAFALQADGWWLRAENIWHKLTPMPESVVDRTTRAHEQVFLLSRSARYFYDNDAVRTPLAAKTLTTFGTQRQQNGGGDLVKSDNWARDVPNREAKRGEDGQPVGANLRSVWPLASKPYPEAHFATFPPDLVKPCILAGAPGGATVLDPFAGAATTGLVATQLGRDFIGIELNPEYVTLGEDRIRRWEANPAGHLKGDPKPLDGQRSIEEVIEEEAAA